VWVSHLSLNELIDNVNKTTHPPTQELNPEGKRANKYIREKDFFK